MAINITYWPAKEGGFLGYMNDYPDYPTQGETLEELKFMLGDILDAIRDGDLEDTAANRMCDSFSSSSRDQGMACPSDYS